MRARGLKPRPDVIQTEELVAPRAGAWIETIPIIKDCEFGRSRPVRARGLKLFYYVYPLGTGESRPVRARGLKRPLFYVTDADKQVAPRAGAWIETLVHVK